MFATISYVHTETHCVKLPHQCKDNSMMWNVINCIAGWFIQDTSHAPGFLLYLVCSGGMNFIGVVQNCFLIEGLLNPIMIIIIKTVDFEGGE